MQSRRLVKTAAQEFKLGRRALIQQMIAGMQAGKKVAKMTQQRREQSRRQAGGQPLEIPLELEVQSYQRMEFLQKDLVGRKFRTWLLLGSLALFVVSYMQVFSPERLAIFMAALILHEGGHLLAMGLFGYQDTALLFLPFLGALATARKDDATLTQKFWISLAGPLPGLILGIGCLAIAAPTQTTGWLLEASWILISLNLFNLLPIYPLDGGQIADLLIFSRHPYIGVIFKMVGVALLGLLGLVQPMMFVFAGLIALGIPNSFRVAKITVKLRSELRQVCSQKDATQQDTLRTILHHLKQLGHGTLPFAQRYTLTKTLLMSHRELHAKRRTRLALSLLYCGSLLGGIFGTLQAVLPNWTGLLAQAAQVSNQMEEHNAEQQRLIETATVAIQANPNDSEAYQQRAQAYLRLQNTEAALADFDQVVRLNPKDIQPLMIRASYRAMTQDYQGAVQDYDRILELQPKNVDAYQNRASYRMLCNNYQGALADYNTAIQLAPMNYSLYLDRAYMRQELKDFKGVIADANTVIRLEPNQPDAYALRSEARRQIGETQAADLDQQKADQLYEVWQVE
ncbi:MAG: tetratricopeptide repeat protein [Cyanobacteria bacterium RM1_2_2]|nr:tetratricopeptide repeat protein [Cyanobacteria bacterium RM1_2_2]